ncbi:WRKY domain-containing protein [Artemisia annua]|uniref:WRKY domain-containing protein n=1 Tax=Artemisia annua TaxID=35608 RepID=A0A2U1MGZ9_ARTAN|nr:WRKY domain-containing protein [Artemisia annua]
MRRWEKKVSTTKEDASLPLWCPSDVPLPLWCPGTKNKIPTDIIPIVGQPPPMLSLPQKQNQNQTSSFENIFTGGPSSGFSPGPMTLVSNYFSDHFSDGSFSQLLAGAMNSPVSQISSEDNKNIGSRGFKDKRPMDLVIAQSPTGFMFPNLFSPSGLLNSPGFFSPLQSPLVSHQQALAHVTAQAALSQSYFNNVQPENYNGGLVNEEETRMLNANAELEDSQIGSPDELSVSQSDVSESQHVISGSADINDGYNWRKYGQKQVKASEHPRSYYKCTHPNCPVKKKVGQALDGHISDIVYKGKHNHDPPPPNKRGKESADVNKPNNSQIEAHVAEQPVVDQGFNQMMRNDQGFSQLMRSDQGFHQMARNDQGYNQLMENVQGSNQLMGNDQVSNQLMRNDQVSNQLMRNDQGSNQLMRIDEPNDEPNPKRRRTQVSSISREIVTELGERLEAERQETRELRDIAALMQEEIERQTDELTEETRMLNANAELEDSQIGSPDELSVSQSDVSESQHVISGSADINDGYNWRKYGQKQVKASEHPRSYYKCTHPNCPVKKKVGQALDGHISDIVYKGKHNHDPPPPNKRGKESADVNKPNNSQIEAHVAEQPVVDQGFNQMMRNDQGFSQLMRSDQGFHQMARNDQGYNQLMENVQGSNQLMGNDQVSNQLMRNDQVSNQLMRNDQGSNQLMRIDEPNDEPNPKRSYLFR